MSEQLPYIVGLGFGGSVESMGAFEWEFRKLLGIMKQTDDSAREKFLAEFRERFAGQVELEPIVLVLDDLRSPLFRAFMEFGKYAISHFENLYVFTVLEQTLEEPHVQFFLNIEADPIGEEMGPNQINLDAEGVPGQALAWMQEQMGVRIYVRDEETMLEFPLE